MEYEQEFPAKLLELARICTLYNYNKNKNYHPSLGNTQGKSYIKFMEAEASIILCRLLRLSAANIIEQMFSNSVRKRVLNALIF
jgi:hypothetical protein